MMEGRPNDEESGNVYYSPKTENKGNGKKTNCFFRNSEYHHFKKHEVSDEK
jgi:hypothetical protein